MQGGFFILTYIWLCKIGERIIVVVGEYCMEHISFISSTSVFAFFDFAIDFSLAVIANSGAMVVAIACALIYEGAMYMSSLLPH